LKETFKTAGSVRGYDDNHLSIDCCFLAILNDMFSCRLAGFLKDKTDYKLSEKEDNSVHGAKFYLFHAISYRHFFFFCSIEVR